MSNITAVSAADITAAAYLTSVPVSSAPINSCDGPPAEVRYVERTPTAAFLTAALPGRIQKPTEQ